MIGIFTWSAISCNLVYVFPENWTAAARSRFPAPILFRTGCEDQTLLLQPDAHLVLTINREPDRHLLTLMTIDRHVGLGQQINNWFNELSNYTVYLFTVDRQFENWLLWLLYTARRSNIDCRVHRYWLSPLAAQNSFKSLWKMVNSLDKRFVRHCYTKYMDRSKVCSPC